jgi:hypothetical protein
MKVLVLSDGKYGDRAYETIKKQFPDTKFMTVEEINPNELLDDVDLPDNIIDAILESDLIISYIRHPDIVYEICYYDKPVIIAIYFGEGFLRSIINDNPYVEMPSSMCHLEPNTKSDIINQFAERFGRPKLIIELDGGISDDPLIKSIKLETQSPCGATITGINALLNKGINPDNLNEFAMIVRQECREPVSLILRRDEMSQAATVNHLESVFEALKEINPELFKSGSHLQKYEDKIKSV